MNDNLEERVVRAHYFWRAAREIRAIPRIGKTAMGLIGVSLLLLATTRPAQAQCVGWTCNGAAMKTTSVVGIGTTNPQNNAEVSSTGTTRLRINSGSSGIFGIGGGNTGTLLTVGETNLWSVAAVATGTNPPDVFFKVYDDLNGRDALTIRQSHVSTEEEFTMAGGVYPSADATYNLGRFNQRWGSVFAANGTIQTSDARLKKDVGDLDGGLGQVLKLRPVTFKWSNGPDSRVHFGLIAQEVEKVIPAIVLHGAKPEDPLGMSYTELVPLLIAAVKTQEMRIIQLEKDRAPIQASMLSGKIGAVSAIGLLPLGLIAAFRARRKRAK